MCWFQKKSEEMEAEAANQIFWSVSQCIPKDFCSWKCLFLGCTEQFFRIHFWFIILGFISPLVSPGYCFSSVFGSNGLTLLFSSLPLSGTGVCSDHHHNCGNNCYDSSDRLLVEPLQSVDTVLHWSAEPKQETRRVITTGELKFFNAMLFAVCMFGCCGSHTCSTTHWEWEVHKSDGHGFSEPKYTAFNQFYAPLFQQIHGQPVYLPWTISHVKQMRNLYE